MSSKNLPYRGQGLVGAPSIHRTAKITAGYGSAYDINMASTGAYKLFDIDAGVIVHEVATQVKVAFGASAVLNVGDTGSSTAFLLDTDIVPNTPGTVLVSTKVAAGASAAKGGKAYPTESDLLLTLSGAAITAGAMDIYVEFSQAQGAE